MTRSVPIVLLAALALLVPCVVRANMCEKSNIAARHRSEAKLARAESFATGTKPGQDYAGDDDYNAWILACNRQRDNRGKEIDEHIDPNNGGRFAQDLPEVSIKGQYSYYGDSVLANLFSSIEYRYRLRRSRGLWIVTLPIQIHVPGVVYGKQGHDRDVPVLSNRLDISQFLAVELGVMSRDGQGSLRCDKGNEKWKSAPHNVYPERFVDTGFISPSDSGSSDGYACRLPLDSTLPGGKRLIDEYYRHWKRVIETAWDRPGFNVQVMIVGLDTFGDAYSKDLSRDDQIWHVHTSLDPDLRARYRSVVLNEPHFYTGAYPSTIAHESGHELGLDDEYREKDKGGKNAWRDCSGSSGTLPGATYLMCEQGALAVERFAGQPGWWDPPHTIQNPDWWTAKESITNPEVAKGIYPWIVTRRYVVGLADQCFSNSECDKDTQYCDLGGIAGIGRNKCAAKRHENDACSADDQCRSPAICKGKPVGKCATEDSVDLGGACTRDLQCKTGSCSSDGRCQCTATSDCSDGEYCDKGIVAGIGRNQCLRKKTENEKCSEDAQCASPAICKGKPLGRCATESSVDVGGACSRDSQCKTGSCDNNGICQCTQDKDCGTGKHWHCDKGTLGVGRNVCVDDRALLDLGGQCQRDSQCVSNSCSAKGRCQCDDDRDCRRTGTGTFKTCRKPITKENYCE